MEREAILTQRVLRDKNSVLGLHEAYNKLHFNRLFTEVLPFYTFYKQFNTVPCISHQMFSGVGLYIYWLGL